MKILLAMMVAVLPCAVWANSMQLPVGKCRYPLPSYPGLNITMVEGEVFRYLYTPSTMVYKAVDSISMILRKVNGEKNMYTEVLKARSILGTPTHMKFNVMDLGDGILKKITDEDEPSYIAAIVDIKGDVALLYVCSDDGDDNGEDFRYVFARKWVDPSTVKHPDILFKATNKKYKFKGKFRKLPQRWSKKSFY